nr:cation-transporting P-type ATPase [Mesorhizobium sp.]
MQSLGSYAERGLTGSEAKRLLAEFGPNELRAVSPMPAWRRLFAQFRDPLVYLLLGAIVVALVAWLVEGREGWPMRSSGYAASWAPMALGEWSIRSSPRASARAG